MADQKLISEIGKYIDRYYEPVKDDIKMDKEMKSIFDRITKFRKTRVEESSLSESALPKEFDVSTMQKTKIKKGVNKSQKVEKLEKQKRRLQRSISFLREK